MKTYTHFLMLLAVAGTFVLTSCSKEQQGQPSNQAAADTSHPTIAPAPVKEGRGRGVVKAMDTTAKKVLLDHNNIPGIMDAMAMNYTVDRAELFRGIHTGDSVTFILQDRGEGNFVVSEITPIAHTMPMKGMGMTKKEMKKMMPMK